MLSNHLKIAWRNLQRRKAFSFITLFGLAIGLAVFGIICMYVYAEASTDDNRPRNLFRVVTTYTTQNNGREGLATVGRALVPTIGREVPGVKAIIPVRTTNFCVSHNNSHYFDRIVYAGNDFIRSFNYNMLAGDGFSALEKPFTVVLTKDMALKYFGTVDVVGKTLRLNDTILTSITGLIENPTSSHVQFDILLSFSTFLASGGDMSPWFTWDTYCYVQLNDRANATETEKKIAALSMLHNGSEYKRVGYNVSHKLERANSINLYSPYGGIHSATGKIQKLYIIGVIGLVLLMLAIINFINLSTSQQAERMKEVGIRKIIGASCASLRWQFITETFVIVFLAGAFAFGLMVLMLPYAGTVVDKTLSPTMLLQPEIALAAFAILLLTTFLAALYPSFLLSRLRPAQSFETYRRAKMRGTFGVRKVLVVFQFAVSIIIIIGTMIAAWQVNFMEQKPLGFAKEQVIVLPLRKLPRQNFIENYNSIRNQLSELHGVTSVSAAAAMPGRTGWGSQVVIPEGFSNDNSLTMEVIPSDHFYVRTLGIGMKSGRDFSTDFETDAAEAVLLNETACKIIGWTPAEVIGKTISTAGIDGGRVVGVMKDYHQHGLQNKIGPVLVFITPAYAYSFIALRTSGNHLAKTISSVENFWKKRFTGYPFDYFMLDDDFNFQYKAERNFVRVTGLFSLLTIVIACLGLFGLAMYATSRRTKEIGIRKILGAGVTNITVMLSLDFLKLVVFAIIIAFPVGWYIMTKWLNDFAYRVDLNVWIFVAAGLIALSIAFVTVSFQAIKTALTNPVKSLRTE